VPLRSTKITLSATFAALVAAAAGCGDAEPPDHAQVCMEEVPEVRAEDENCENGTRGFTWVYVPRSYGAPAVGTKMVPATFSPNRPSVGTISTVRPAGIGGSSYGNEDSAGS